MTTLVNPLQLDPFDGPAFQRLVEVVDHGVRDEPWQLWDAVELTVEELDELHLIVGRSAPLRSVLLNEATLWCRTHFPLLMLAEGQGVVAWAQAPVTAAMRVFTLEGVVDGVLARGSDAPGAPALVVVQGKRGGSPKLQLCAALLAAAYAQSGPTTSPVVSHGVFTVANIWTFVEATVEGLHEARPRMELRSSREYSTSADGERILKIMRGVVGLHS
jgi:hypothetical protein